MLSLPCKPGVPGRFISKWRPTSWAPRHGPSPARPRSLPAPLSAGAASISEAIALLKTAKRPLIYVGGGAVDAAPEVNQLARLIEAPVTSFRSGRGIVDDRDYHAQVFPAGRRLWANADVVFAIGTRLKYPQLYWGLDENIKIIRLDIDAHEFDRYAQPAVSLHGDAGATLSILLPELERSMTRRPLRAKRN